MARTDTLGNFLTDVADAIRTKKGSSDTILASDFDTEIENLPSGGNIPTTLQEINSNLVTMADNFIAYVRSLPLTYQVYTNESVTLYSPAQDYNYYMIQKISSGKYRILWFQFDVTGFDNYGIYQAKWLTETTGNRDPKNEIHDAFRSEGTISLQLANSSFYYSDEFNTINECIQKLQSNQTSYNSMVNNMGYQTDTPYIVPYTNASILKKGLSVYEATALLSQKISSNETIEVI